MSKRWFKKGAGTVVRSTSRAVPTTVPAPFLNRATNCRDIGRRQFIQDTCRGMAGASIAAKLALAAAEEARASESSTAPLGKAEHCIFIWLAGGACQIDTWDPKRRGDPVKKVPGSYYDSINTAIKDVQVCEHLGRTADRLDRGIIVRSVFHNVIDEHAAAMNRLHTGRPTSGTIVYPSLGSVVSHQLGPGGDGVPSYVVMGYPNASRGSGFLGARHGYIYLTETKAGPAGLQRPKDISADRQARRERLLKVMRDGYVERNRGQKLVEDYTSVSEAAQRLSGPQFMNVFDLARESGRLRERYGSEFGQRLLLARRLVQSGVRFIEVTSNLNFQNGTGWDTHNEGQLNQHELIIDLDQGLAALLDDLETKRLLDKTLIVVATEFGRPPKFDARGGRGHQSKAFSVALFGGGMRTGQVHGQTDELGADVVQNPVSVPDLHATIYQALAINASHELYAGDRPVPITDHGRPIRQLFV